MNFDIIVSMKMNLIPNIVRRIDGQRIGLSWLDKIESVYSDEATYMNWHTHGDLRHLEDLRFLNNFAILVILMKKKMAFGLMKKNLQLKQKKMSQTN